MFSSLQSKIAVFFIAMMSIVSSITLYALYNATREHSLQQVEEKINVGHLVVENKLATLGDSLLQGAVIFAKDFSSIRTLLQGKDDPESLRYALENQKRRLNADIVLAVSERSFVLAGSQNKTLAGDSFVLSGLLESEPAQLFEVYQDSLYLFSSAPVYTHQSDPNRKPFAWVIFGTQVNNLFASELNELTSLEVTFVISDGELSTVAASSLSKSLLKNSQPVFSNVVHPLHSFAVNGEDYLFSRFLLQDTPEVSLVLQQQEAAALLSFTRFQSLVVIITAFAILAASIGALVISRGITRPIRLLVEKASEIGKGDYETSIPILGSGEVGVLSDALKSMQGDIQQREKTITELAYFDKLTKLPNRISFQQNIERAIFDEKVPRFIVVIMDLNRFKEINDTLGHAIGDKLLVEVAQRMSVVAESKYLISRLGGDEFAVLVAPCDLNQIGKVTRQFCSVMSETVTIDGINLDMSGSFGVAQYPEHGNSADLLMQRADVAMYQAKEGHRELVIYDNSTDKHSLLRLSLMSELRTAIDTHQLQLYYQPKLDLMSGKICQAECLVRWIHPVHGFIGPDEFIPLAEQTGNVRYLTRWAIRIALEQCRFWRMQNIEIAVAVNISAVDLLDESLVDFVSDMLTEVALTPDCLILEVTESAVVHDPERAIKILTRLRKKGIRLSIDDYGTGYSSMAQLKKLPVHELKIDKSFVTHLANDEDDEIIVKSTIELGHNMGLKIVAEGVEDRIALTKLRAFGCDVAQGYLIAKPMPLDSFGEWLLANNQEYSIDEKSD